MAFEIRLHSAEDILEVVYPERPDAQSMAEYAVRVRAAIDERQGKPWVCLVDQRRLQVMPPDLVPTVAALNAYAEARGMQRSARLVTTAIAELQARRMVREASLSVPSRTFESRDAAISWLRAGLRA